MIYMTEAEWEYISYCLERNDWDAIETKLCVNTCKLDMSEQELDGIIRDYKVNKQFDKKQNIYYS